jgi:hypothetical protein
MSTELNDANIATSAKPFAKLTLRLKVNSNRTSGAGNGAAPGTKEVP